jgi:PAS domain S-box-containing protein
MNDANLNQPTRFPAKLLALALVFSSLILLALVWSAWQSYRNVQTVQMRDLRVEELRGIIVHLDEVLTMSARMAAVTGDLAWERRYRQFEARLDDAVKEAIRLTAGSGSAEAAAQTDVANLKLVTMENQAFDLVRAGNPGAAKDVLFSEAYEAQKRIYADGMVKFMDRLKDVLAASQKRKRDEAILSIAGAILASLLLFGTWIIVLGRLQVWRTAQANSYASLLQAEEELRQTHQMLEQRVQDRTRELQSSEERFRSLSASAPIGIFLTDAAGSGLYTNPEWQSIAGLSLAQSLGEGWQQAVHPDDAARIFAEWKNAIAEGRAFSQDFRFRKSDGDVRWVHAQAVAIRGETGRVTGHVGTVEDITERRRAEQTIREKEEFIRSVIDTDPNLIFVKDRHGRFAMVNRAMAEFNGRTVAEMTGLRDVDIHADARQVAGFRQDDLLVLDTLREKFIPEELQVDRFGQNVWVQTVKRPLITAEGRAEFVLGVATNITERKRAEQFLESILQNLPIVVFAKEAKELRNVLWNRANEELCGYTRAEILGKCDHDLFPKAQADAFMARDRAVLARGQLVEFEEEIATRHHGKRTLRTRKIPILDERGQPLYLLGIAEDITERKAAEAELEQTHRELMAASRRAGMAEVATGVLHNIGNVLNSVNVAAGCVADRLRKSKTANLTKLVALLREHEADLAAFFTGDPKGRQVPAYLAQLAAHLAEEQAAVLAELDHLQKNIEHIKDIVAMQQSYAKVSGVCEEVSVVDLVEDTLRMNASALARHEVEVTREFDPHLPKITVEKHKVLQILVNLVRNAKHACDAAGRTGKRVTVRVRQENGRVQIAVFDNGIGIPAENLIRIFNHGFTTKKEGHGFGLHSGALAARTMGGSLHVHSDGPGQGAAFTLELPLAPPAQDARDDLPVSCSTP